VRKAACFPAGNGLAAGLIFSSDCNAIGYLLAAEA
jgi:hypothetical protein